MTDRCRECGEREHPAYPDCPHCRGTGHVIGGDAYRPCSRCRLRAPKER